MPLDVEAQELQSLTSVQRARQEVRKYERIETLTVQLGGQVSEKRRQTSLGAYPRRQRSQTSVSMPSAPESQAVSRMKLAEIL
jgi:hypothetical protein